MPDLQHRSLSGRGSGARPQSRLLTLRHGSWFRCLRRTPSLFPAPQRLPKQSDDSSSWKGSCDSSSFWCSALAVHRLFLEQDSAGESGGVRQGLQGPLRGRQEPAPAAHRLACFRAVVGASLSVHSFARARNPPVSSRLPPGPSLPAVCPPSKPVQGLALEPLSTRPGSAGRAEPLGGQSLRSPPQPALSLPGVEARHGPAPSLPQSGRNGAKVQAYHTSFPCLGVRPARCPTHFLLQAGLPACHLGPLLLCLSSQLC